MVGLGDPVEGDGGRRAGGPPDSSVAAWDATAVKAFAASGSSTAEGYIIAAYVSIAVYDAVMAVEGGYEPFAVDIDAPDGASPEAAVAAAARGVLVHYLPAQAAAIVEPAYESSLAAIADGQAETDGVAMGAAVAAQLIELRADDGFRAPVTYTPPNPPIPGVWLPTASTPPVGPYLKGMEPFSLRSADQFRPNGPPPLNSLRWARDYNEVKDIGSATSTTRTAEQTLAARFWAEPPVQQSRGSFRRFVLDHQLDIVDAARFMAMVSVTQADAFIACFDAKYEYTFWRPITAIRAGGTDDNAATIADPAWTTLLPGTPNHPEYPERPLVPHPRRWTGHRQVPRQPIDRLHRSQRDRPRRPPLHPPPRSAGRCRQCPHLGRHPLPHSHRRRHYHLTTRLQLGAHPPFPPIPRLTKRNSRAMRRRLTRPNDSETLGRILATLRVYAGERSPKNTTERRINAALEAQAISPAVAKRTLHTLDGMPKRARTLRSLAVVVVAAMAVAACSSDDSGEPAAVSASAEPTTAPPSSATPTTLEVTPVSTSQGPTTAPPSTATPTSLEAAPVDQSSTTTVSTTTVSAGIRYLDPTFQVDVQRDVLYGTASTPDGSGGVVELRLDVYTPRGDTESKRPVFIYSHGGGFAVGDKSEGIEWATRMAELGYVAASIDYRLGPLTNVTAPPDEQRAGPD